MQMSYRDFSFENKLRMKSTSNEEFIKIEDDSLAFLE